MAITDKNVLGSYAGFRVSKQGQIIEGYIRATYRLPSQRQPKDFSRRDYKTPWLQLNKEGGVSPVTINESGPNAALKLSLRARFDQTSRVRYDATIEVAKGNEIKARTALEIQDEDSLVDWFWGQVEELEFSSKDGILLTGIHEDMRSTDEEALAGLVNSNIWALATQGTNLAISINKLTADKRGLYMDHVRWEGLNYLVFVDPKTSAHSRVIYVHESPETFHHHANLEIANLLEELQKIDDWRTNVNRAVKGSMSEQIPAKFNRGHIGIAFIVLGAILMTLSSNSNLVISIVMTFGLGRLSFKNYRRELDSAGWVVIGIFITKLVALFQGG